jgi:hypothetical protein
MRTWPAFLLLAAVTTASAQHGDTVGPLPLNSGSREENTWQESKAELPPFPKQENLHEFFVSAATSNTYFIDASTLTVGEDRVVRYVLVVETSGGASNVSFEGINCEILSWKLYATGRRDGTWHKTDAHRVKWRHIENKPINGYHAAMSRYLFCPNGVAVLNADEGRKALRLGKHPDANR